MDRLRRYSVAAVLCLAVTCAFAQKNYIALRVDATQAPLKVLHTRLIFPAKPGPLTLYYPKWVPGLHEPAGPIANVTGLKFAANGKTVPWHRDLVDMFAFHVDVPAGVSQLEASFDYLEPSGFGGGPAAGTTTSKLMVLNWNQVVLYPAGTPAALLAYKASLALPPGWKFGTALETDGQPGGDVSFRPVTLERLVDSPLIAGEYYRTIDLTPPGEPIHHEIDIVADSAVALAMPADVQRGLTNVVAESGKLFGARHYREYHFLLTLSDHTGHFGVEHHESNDSRLGERVFLSPGAARQAGGLLAHEFAHSWSGKFRRPLDLSTPDFQAPMQTDLLWVYEGNTSYLGDLLAARSGMWTADDYRQTLADIAASLGPGRPGRTWRPLLDTAVAIPGMFSGGGMGNWRRGSDYYQEGELIWLEVANIIHEKSSGAKSIDDFFQIFYGGANNGPEVKTYTFDELVQDLNRITPYDWKRFLEQRLESTSPDAPLGGIEASGWKVTYIGEAGSGGRPGRGAPPSLYSIGMTVGGDGNVSDTIYDGLAYKAGVRPGMKLVGVNGRLYTSEILADAIRGSKNSTQAIELLLVADDYYKTCRIDYHEGERFPRLVRDASKPDYLDELLKSRAGSR